MTTIYLIRHAEAEGNLYRIAQGQANSSITDRGERQIQALARRFADIPIDAVYDNDLYRQRHIQAQGPAPAPAAGPAGDLRGRVGGEDLGRDRPAGPGAAGKLQPPAPPVARRGRGDAPGSPDPAAGGRAGHCGGQ